MKKIILLATGGTIASRRTESGLTPQLPPQQLLDFIPEAHSFCQVEAIELFQIDSTNFQPGHWLQLARAIREHYEQCDGFVICHGTDTMAYTAAALSYLVQASPKPIVVTGAQRPIDEDSTDARVNLLDSLRLACDSRAHDVLLVFGGKVIAGTRAEKMFTKSDQAFASINFPNLAAIRDGRIYFYFPPLSPPDGPVFYDRLNGRVLLLKLIPGLDAQLLSFAQERCDALIVEGFGVGGLPARLEDGVQRLVESGKTVVMTTQVTHEGSDMTVYRVGHVAKHRFGLLETFDMTLEATVAKLMWILAQTREPSEIRRFFYTPINHDLMVTEARTTEKGALSLP